jgi:hypothetical protein
MAPVYLNLRCVESQRATRSSAHITCAGACRYFGDDNVIYAAVVMKMYGLKRRLANDTPMMIFTAKVNA